MNDYNYILFNDYYKKISIKLEVFLNNYKKLRKCSKITQKLKDILIQSYTNYSGKQIDKYALNIIIEKYYNPTSFIKKFIFFPDEYNKNKVVNMIRIAKK